MAASPRRMHIPIALIQGLITHFFGLCCSTQDVLSPIGRMYFPLEARVGIVEPAAFDVRVAFVGRYSRHGRGGVFPPSMPLEKPLHGTQFNGI